MRVYFLLLYDLEADGIPSEGHSKKEDEEKWGDEKGEDKNALEYCESPLS